MVLRLSAREFDELAKNIEVGKTCEGILIGQLLGVLTRPAQGLAVLEQYQKSLFSMPGKGEDVGLQRPRLERRARHLMLARRQENGGLAAGDAGRSHLLGGGRVAKQHVPVAVNEKQPQRQLVKELLVILGSAHGAFAYHNRTEFFLAMGAPAGTLNALANSVMLESGPLTLK
jgi:hypothetical protein